MGFFSDHRLKKIVILLGHPNGDPGTLSYEMATAYEAAAKKAGHQVRRFNLADLEFDPILHKGYKTIQSLEPDLLLLQDAIKWANHFVVIYPNWWCTMPALLKGMFDRMWLPGFCFNMRKHNDGTPAAGWIKRMKGKTSRVIVLSGTHPFLIWLMFGDYTNEIKRGILWFAGFKVKLTRIGPTDHAPEWKVNEWMHKAAKLGKLGE